MSQFTSLNTVEDREPGLKFESNDAQETFPKVKAEEDESDAGIKKEPDVEANGKKNRKEVMAAEMSPTTPRKRGRKSAGEKIAGEAEEGANEGSPSKKKRASPKKTVANGVKPAKVGQRPLPTSYETASEEDKMLLRMKDEEGRSWAEIRQAWGKLTGDKVGNSTLSGRYARIKANFVVISDDDETRLVKFLKEIEEKFEREKWHRVAEAIEHDGGNKYPPTALQKKFKELSKKMGSVSINETETTADDYNIDEWGVQPRDPRARYRGVPQAPPLRRSLVPKPQTCLPRRQPGVSDTRKLLPQPHVSESFRALPEELPAPAVPDLREALLSPQHTLVRFMEDSLSASSRDWSVVVRDFVLIAAPMLPEKFDGSPELLVGLRRWVKERCKDFCVRGAAQCLAAVRRPVRGTAWSSKDEWRRCCRI
ncbi:hypothetical protein VTO42DRAFT_8903 [Malbranchea cinnamomea]